LEKYFQLLATWNARINLTGMDLSDPTPEAFDRLVVEPVAAARYAPVRTARVMDIGSGGGSPAIPFALALGGVRLRMVESKTRKSVFLREAVRALALPGAEVVTARYEDLVARDEYRGQEDLLTARAVRMDAAVLEAVRLLFRPGGQIFLFTSAEGGRSVGVPNGLSLVTTVPLVESLGSGLTVLQRDR
jgi:16S rRNA (guanine527-N7)-methyltransferase